MADVIDAVDVQAAASRIAGHVRRTPVIQTETGAFTPGTRTWLKLEHLQYTGSFKARGAFNRILAALEHAEGSERPMGVVAASGGNAGLAVAYAAGRRGLPARVFVPETAPPVKVKKLAELGADVRQVGDRYDDAYRAALADADQTGALFCHAYDQPEVCAGQGTLALELLEQTHGAVDTVLVAVGGGGLLAGIAAALDGTARVVGVEPVTASTLHAALEAGHLVDVDVSGVAADSLGATRIGEIAVAVAGRTDAGSVVVGDVDIVAARRRLWSRHRLVVEHGTAAALAALETGVYRPAAGERVAVILCGANTDPSDLG